MGDDVDEGMYTFYMGSPIQTTSYNMKMCGYCLQLEYTHARTPDDHMNKDSIFPIKSVK